MELETCIVHKKNICILYAYPWRSWTTNLNPLKKSIGTSWTSPKSFRVCGTRDPLIITFAFLSFLKTPNIPMYKRINNRHLEPTLYIQIIHYYLLYYSMLHLKNTHILIKFLKQVLVLNCKSHGRTMNGRPNDLLQSAPPGSHHLVQRNFLTAILVTHVLAGSKFRTARCWATLGSIRTEVIC